MRLLTHTQNHPAVQRCLAAARAAQADAETRQQERYQCEDCFKQAYVEALPDLSTYQNVCDFITCVTYAMIIGVMYEKETKSYLYAAQVALSAVPRPAKKAAAEAA
jgi:hypothetical protein